MAKKPLLSITIDISGMKDALKQAPKQVRKGIANAINKIATKGLRRTRNRTAVDTGKARGGWKLRFTNQGLTAFISNNVDYINVLEFGGYPVRSSKRGKSSPGRGSFTRGRAILGGSPPGPRTRRAGTGDLQPPAKPSGRTWNSNVSSAAPLGMLRITFAELALDFQKTVEREIDKVFAKLNR